LAQIDDQISSRATNTGNVSVLSTFPGANWTDFYDLPEYSINQHHIFNFEFQSVVGIFCCFFWLL